MEWINIKKGNIDYSKFDSDLRRKFPKSHQLLLDYDFSSQNYLIKSLAFFEQHKIVIHCYPADSLKHPGTFTAVVKLTSQNLLQKLNRKTDSIRYSHRSSEESAMRRALFKAHEIINTLENGRQMPEKARRN